MNLQWPGDSDEPLTLCLERLAERDGQLADKADWPGGLWAELVRVGAHQWAVDQATGAVDPDRVLALRRYAQIASGSLSAAFILTQHDASVRRLAVALAQNQRLLEHIRGDQSFVTVGISQLTTSRRHGAHAMRVTPAGDGFVLNGIMPWVTAADHAQVIVTGGILDDGRQLLAHVRVGQKGLTIDAPFDLAAMRCSRTSGVRCADVVVAADQVLAGPSDDVMSTPGLTGTGGLETSALALGQAFCAIRSLGSESEQRPELKDSFEALASNWHETWSMLEATAVAEPGSLPSSAIRSQANSLALRSTQAYLTGSKGSGFVSDHPAQRWARQALFFLVWSCPSPVARAAIDGFAGVCESGLG